MNKPHPSPLNRIEALLAIMADLRDPNGGCPWDLEQTFRSIAPYTLEEAYEVADAIERSNLDDLKEELGDLLLQVVFHARMAEEQNAFQFSDVVESIATKMIRRHPHVFGAGTAGTAQEVSATWDEIKQAEKVTKLNAPKGLLDDVPVVLSSLTQAVKLQKRAAKVGFDWPSAEPVLAKFEEEMAELREATEARDADHMEEEFGDLLFVLANYARHLKIDPDAALRRANQKFRNRFGAMEGMSPSREALAAMSLDELEALWVRAKKLEKAKP
ncbi:MAG: nucleoside triphosphate pyrophosphohydrolase [Parvibaculum sp.]